MWNYYNIAKYKEHEKQTAKIVIGCILNAKYNIGIGYITADIRPHD